MTKLCKTCGHGELHHYYEKRKEGCHYWDENNNECPCKKFEPVSEIKDPEKLYLAGKITFSEAMRMFSPQKKQEER